MEKLTYTFSNEDSETELELMENNLKNVAVISGSGARVIPLFFKSPNNVYCIDTSAEQLWLTEFRIEVFRQLEYPEMLYILGYKKSEENNNREIFNKLNLSLKCENYMRQYFDEIQWANLLFSGVWEQSFVRTSSFINKMLPNLKNSLQNALSVEEHFSLLKKISFKLRFISGTLNFGVFVLAFWNYLTNLYPHITYDKIKGSKRSLMKELQLSLGAGKIIENFYYSTLLTGSYNHRVSPTAEISEKRFQDIKRNIKKSTINFINEDVYDFVASPDLRFDFVSLSNTLDYVPQGQISHRIGQMKQGLKIGAKVVIRRCFPANVSLEQNGFRKSSKMQDLRTIAADKTPFYQTELLIVE